MADPRSALRDAAGRAWGGTRGFLATRRGKLIAGGTAAVLIIGAGGGAVFAATRNDDSRYRTATAATGEVTETLALTGQLTSSSSSSVAFQVAGTVGDVLVKLGDTVTAGQKLATLDTDDLEAAVTSAEDAVASAQQQLEDDLDSQANGSSSSTSSTGSSGGSGFSGDGMSGGGSGGSTGGSAGGSTGGSTTPTPTSTSPSAGDGSGDGGGSGSVSDDADVVAAAQAVKDAQDALLAQYDAATSAQEASSAAAAQAQDVCEPFLNATLSEDGTIETDEDAAAASDALEATQDLLTACQTSISDTLDKQKTTSAAQDALNEKAAALDDTVSALQNAIAAAEAATSSDTGAATSSLNTTGRRGLTVVTASIVTAAAADDAAGGSGGSGGSGASGGTSTTITSQDILADRAQIDLEKANLAIAEQDLEMATLTSPLAGTVVDVALAVGDEVSAASTTATITVQGADGYIVQSTVSLSKIAKVAVGQTAEVTLPAFGQTYAATVTSVGVLNESSTSTPAYTVTLGVDTGDDEPRIGATAQAALALSAASDVLTVPTSAVSISATGASVVVVQGGTARTVSVEIGAVGTELTEITEGLDPGDKVVLADLTEAITSSDDSTSTSLSDLGGDSSRGTGFQGGGFPGGGDFQGGPPGN